jgi:hypothetical protein
MFIRAESWEFILKPTVHNTVRYRAAANEQIIERMAVPTNFREQWRDVKFLLWVIAAAVIAAMLLLGACA